MRPELLKQTLKALYAIRRTVCIEGPPGIGKTTLAREVSRDLGIAFHAVHLPTALVEDLGVLMLGEETIKYRLPDWYPAVGRDDVPDHGILLIDDRNQASPDLQKVLANICQARTLHGVPLKEGWMIISTGNRQSDRAGANRVLSHLRNRETVLEMEPHLDDWTTYALAHGVKPEVVSFLRFRPDLLNKFDPQADQNPTSRSWVDGVSAVLGVVPHEAEYESFKGAVGEGAAAEFLGYLKICRKLPDPDMVLSTPATTPIPTDPATLYALSGMLAYRTTPQNMAAAVTYVSRMPAEFAVLYMNLVTKRDVSLCNGPAWTAWIHKFGDLCL